MVKQWVQPPINKNRLPPGGFFIRVPSHMFFIIIIKVFIGILGESFETQFVAICYLDFNQGFNQI